MARRRWSTAGSLSPGRYVIVFADPKTRILYARKNFQTAKKNETLAYEDQPTTYVEWESFILFAKCRYQVSSTPFSANYHWSGQGVSSESERFEKVGAAKDSRDSTRHKSRTFNKMFGITPSEIFKNKSLAQVVFCNS